MKEEIIKLKQEDGSIINVSALGMFQIPDLSKRYVIYALEDDNPNNEDATIMIGEVINDGDYIEITGILPEERNIVIAYYNEISSQLGENENE